MLALFSVKLPTSLNSVVNTIYKFSIFDLTLGKAEGAINSIFKFEKL